MSRLKTFNKENFHLLILIIFKKSYLKKEQKEVIHRDKQNDILIKIIRLILISYN